MAHEPRIAAITQCLAMSELRFLVGKSLLSVFTEFSVIAQREETTITCSDA